MPASCICKNLHHFTSRVLEDSPEINALVLEDQECPECGADFDVTEIYGEDNDIRDL
jgi:hypothetical protein